MERRYILIIGELYAIVTHIRAIGNLIPASLLEDAWI